MSLSHTKKILKLDGSGYSIEEHPLASDEKRRGFYFVLGRVSELGFVIAVPIVGGVFLGRWLDGKFGTLPVLTIIGILAGVSVAFGSLYRIVKDFS